MNVLEDMNAQMKLLGISYETYAKMLFREVSTVKKTIIPGKGNPTLETLYIYAAALGGDIVFLSAEALHDMQESNVGALSAQVKECMDQVEAMKQEVSIRDQRIEAMKQEVAIRDQRIADKDITIETLTAQVLRQSNQLDAKDDTINKLLNKFVLND